MCYVVLKCKKDSPDPFNELEEDTICGTLTEVHSRMLALDMAGYDTEYVEIDNADPEETESEDNQ